MRVTAFAKLNLNLHVTGRRGDGYHMLESLVVFSEFGDVLEFLPSPTLSLEVCGPFAPSLASTQDNLVYRAARQLQTACGRDVGAHIILHKNIPVGAGLGGGSADAAATLRALNMVWSGALTEYDLHQLACRLGSDVPVCLRATPAWIKGVGDETVPAVWSGAPWLVLLYPGKPLLTAAVFGSYKGPYSDAAATARKDYGVNDMQAMHNDLQTTAIALLPEIATMITALESLPGCQLARMSGSGSSCFGIYATQPEAQQALAAIKTHHPGWWGICTTMRNT